MIDTALLKKKWGTAPKPKKKPVKKKVVKKTVEKKPEPEPKGKQETVPPSGRLDTGKRKSKTNDLDDMDEKSLEELAGEAMLREKISKAELAAYKVEQQKLDLDVKAGNIAEVPYMEFVYISHIEKMYVDLLRMVDKIKPKLTPFIQDQDEAGAIKLLKKEIIDTIRNVKQGQKEALKSWKKDLRS